MKFFADTADVKQIGALHQKRLSGGAGADFATLPPDLFPKKFLHPLTDAGLAKLDSDWRASGGKII